MSEPDDKPQAGAADSQSKSLFDSEWDALLGDAASSSPSKPSPVPASADTAEPERVEPAQSASLRVADSVPRNSTSRASVSGAYVGPQPRPEPATPPRYERPEGVSPYYDDPDEPYGDPESETGDYGMAPRIEPAVLEASTMAATLGLATGNEDEGSEREAQAEVIELPRVARAPDDSSSSGLAASSSSSSSSNSSSSSSSSSMSGPREPIDADGGGSRGTLLVIGLLAVVGLIIVAVTQLGGRQDRGKDTVAREGEAPSPSGQTKTTAGDARPTPLGPATASETETGDETGDESGDTGEGSGSTQPKPKPIHVDPRDPSLIPPGTPEEHAKAFLKLPVSLHDGPPVGGIGPTGLHIDAISTSRGRDNTECDNPTEIFSLAVAKYVNVCFRVVHPRELDSLRVIWEKDGKVTRRGRVRIPELHAYTTRAYLLLRPEYVGDWRVRIVPEGEESIDLAVAEFVITE